MRTSFVLYTNYGEKFKRLSDAQMGQLLRVIFEYEETEVVPKIEDAAVSMAFDVIKFDLDRDNAKFQERCIKNREAGSKGGQAKAAKAKQDVANASESYQTVANATKSKRSLAKPSKTKQNVHEYEYENEYVSENEYENKLKPSSINNGLINPESQFNLEDAPMVMLPGTENFIRVWNAFERLNINLEASTAGRDISRFLNHGMQPEVLMLAAEIAGNNAAKGWIYPLRILEGWDKKGILTLPQAQQEQAEHNAKRARREREKAARASGTRPADYYDPADYAKDDPDGTAWAEMFESLQAH